MEFSLAPLYFEELHMVQAVIIIDNAEQFIVSLYNKILMMLRKIVVTIYADKTLHAPFASSINSAGRWICKT
jgi:hypothetical protein